MTHSPGCRHAVAAAGASACSRGWPSVTRRARSSSSPMPGRDERRRRRTPSSTTSRSATGATCCSEVIELRLQRRARRSTPAIVVLPLLDLRPARLPAAGAGEPPWGAPGARPSSSTSPTASSSTRPSGTTSPRVRPARGASSTALAASDIAWARAPAGARVLADRWPGHRRIERDLGRAARAPRRCCSPGWLGSRLGRDDRRSTRRGRAALERCRARRRAASRRRRCRRSPSDLLSAELDRFGRDPVYEAAVRAAVR